jgi:hypothetical protein
MGNIRGWRVGGNNGVMMWRSIDNDSMIFSSRLLQVQWKIIRRKSTMNNLQTLKINAAIEYDSSYHCILLETASLKSCCEIYSGLILQLPK